MVWKISGVICMHAWAKPLEAWGCYTVHNGKSGRRISITYVFLSDKLTFFIQCKPVFCTHKVGLAFFVYVLYRVDLMLDHPPHRCIDNEASNSVSMHPRADVVCSGSAHDISPRVFCLSGRGTHHYQTLQPWWYNMPPADVTEGCIICWPETLNFTASGHKVQNHRSAQFQHCWKPPSPPLPSGYLWSH